jgi:hypothetical protein
MRCIYCHKRAGLLRRVCDTCAKVIAIVERAAGEVGMLGIVDIFIAEGITRQQADAVFDAEIDGQPTLRDKMTSNIANTLMRNLGMPGRQSPDDVRKIREAVRAGGGAGTYTAGQKPPGID